MSPETLIDERFDELVSALRAETPSAPDDLRDRVARAAAVPAPTRRTPPIRRLLTVALPAALAASLAAAVFVGVRTAATTDVAQESPEAVESRARDDSGEEGPASSARTQLRSAAPGPNPSRAQDYSATLRILAEDVDDLSAATQRALRATRRLGGYVVSVQYGTPAADEGSATLQVRVPVTRVQAAIVQFSDLGRILAQEVQISDLQQPLDELTRRIRRLERRNAELRAALRDPSLSPAERRRLEAALAANRRSVAALRRQRTEINRRAAFATVGLELTTREPKQQEPAPGRLERAVDDATGVLAAELAIGAYALIVASPFLLLLAAGLFGNRAYRRHADQRLLERA